MNNKGRWSDSPLPPPPPKKGYLASRPNYPSYSVLMVFFFLLLKCYLHSHYTGTHLHINSTKRWCTLRRKKSWTGHDLPISVNDRVISPIREGLILTKLRICEVSRKLNSRENSRINSRFHFVVWFLVSSFCWRNGVGGGCLGYVHAVVWQSVLRIFLAVLWVGLRFGAFLSFSLVFRFSRYVWELCIWSLVLFYGVPCQHAIADHHRPTDWLTVFGYNVSVPRSLRTRRIQHLRHTQFYAPTLPPKRNMDCILSLSYVYLR